MERFEVTFEEPPEVIRIVAVRLPESGAQALADAILHGFSWSEFPEAESALEQLHSALTRRPR